MACPGHTWLCLRQPARAIVHVLQRACRIRTFPLGPECHTHTGVRLLDICRSAVTCPCWSPQVVVLARRKVTCSAEPELMARVAGETYRRSASVGEGRYELLLRSFLRGVGAGQYLDRQLDEFRYPATRLSCRCVPIAASQCRQIRQLRRIGRVDEPAPVRICARPGAPEVAAP